MDILCYYRMGKVKEGEIMETIAENFSDAQVCFDCVSHKVIYSQALIIFVWVAIISLLALIIYFGFMHFRGKQ
jgi:hypothetical protein